MVHHLASGRTPPPLFYLSYGTVQNPPPPKCTYLKNFFSGKNFWGENFGAGRRPAQKNLGPDPDPGWPVGVFGGPWGPIWVWDKGWTPGQVGPGVAAQHQEKRPKS